MLSHSLAQLLTKVLALYNCFWQEQADPNVDLPIAQLPQDLLLPRLDRRALASLHQTSRAFRTATASFLDLHRAMDFRTPPDQLKELVEQLVQRKEGPQTPSEAIILIDCILESGLDSANKLGLLRDLAAARPLIASFVRSMKTHAAAKEWLQDDLFQITPDSASLHGLPRGLFDIALQFSTAVPDSGTDLHERSQAAIQRILSHLRGEHALDVLACERNLELLARVGLRLDLLEYVNSVPINPSTFFNCLPYLRINQALTSRKLSRLPTELDVPLLRCDHIRSRILKSTRSLNGYLESYVGTRLDAVLQTLAQYDVPMNKHALAHSLVSGSPSLKLQLPPDVDIFTQDILVIRSEPHELLQLSLLQLLLACPRNNIDRAQELLGQLQDVLHANQQQLKFQCRNVLARFADRWNPFSEGRDLYSRPWMVWVRKILSYFNNQDIDKQLRVFCP